MNSDNALFQKKYESLSSRIAQEKADIEKLILIISHNKQEQTHLNIQLLSINEELEELLKQVGGRLDNINTKVKNNNTAETNNENLEYLANYYREHADTERESTQRNEPDEEIILIYNILEETLKQAHEKFLTIFKKTISAADDKTNNSLETNVVLVHFLETPNEYKTKTQKAQTFRVYKDLKMEFLIKESLNFWELSNETSKYDIYAIDSNKVPVEYVENDVKNLGILVENYFKNLGRISSAILFIIIKSNLSIIFI